MRQVEAESVDSHPRGIAGPAAVWAAAALASSVALARIFGVVFGLGALLLATTAGLVWAVRGWRRVSVEQAAIVLLLGSVLVPYSAIPPVGGLVTADDVVFGTGVALVAVSMWQRRRAIRMPLLVWPLLALAGWSTFVWAIGDRGLGPLLRGPVRLFLYALIVMAALSWFRDRTLSRFVIDVLVLVALVEAVFAVFSYYAPFEVAGRYIGIEPIRSYDPIYEAAPGRAVGTLGLASNFLGAYFLIPAAAVLGLGSRSRSRRELAAWSTIYLVLFWAMVLSFTRASFVAAVLAAAGYFLWTRRARMMPVVAVAIIGALVFTPFASRFQLGNDRLRLAQEAVQVIGEHPVVGIGPGEYVPETGATTTAPPATGIAEPPENEEPVRVTTPHNSFLLFAGELGIVGGVLALLAALLPFLAAVAVRRDRRDLLVVAVGAGLGAFLLQTLSNNLLHIPVVTVQFWIASAWAVVAAAEAGGRLAGRLLDVAEI